MDEKTERKAYSGLAAGIVLQAVTDWRKLIKHKAWLDTDVSAVNFDEIRKFLKSEYCLLLLHGSAVKQEKILEQLENELKEAKEKHENESESRTRKLRSRTRTRR